MNLEKKMKDYTIKEAKMFRSQLSENILYVLQDFESQTGLSIENINISRAQTGTGEKNIIGIEIDIDF